MQLQIYFQENETPSIFDLDNNFSYKVFLMNNYKNTNGDASNDNVDGVLTIGVLQTHSTIELKNILWNIYKLCRDKSIARIIVSGLENEDEMKVWFDSEYSNVNILEPVYDDNTTEQGIEGCCVKFVFLFN